MSTSPIDHLAHALSKLPGVGQKSAMRLAFHIMRAPKELADDLLRAIAAVKEQMQFCRECHTPAPQERCGICSDARREQERICVVEDPADVGAIERSGAYRGIYHILHGVLSPLDGIGPSDLKIDALLQRLQERSVQEIILAMNPTVEGEATAAYLASVLKIYDIPLTRIASGIPFGAEVEYVDAHTLAIAMHDRRPMS